MAAKTYTIRVNVIGSDKASGPLNKFGGSLLGLRNVIGGILGANLLLAFGRQIVGLGRDALNSVQTYEQMGFTLQTLVARELARGKVLQRVSTQVRALTTHEKLRIIALDEAYGDLTHTLAKTNRMYDEAVRMTGEESKAALELKVQLQSLSDQMVINRSELGALNRLEAEGIKTLESYTVGVMSMGEALKAATPIAQELIKWVEDLAIASPFDLKGVTIALRTALAYGMNLDMAKRLTRATIDFSAASGLSSETLTRIARAMGQVQGKGRLMAEEVRQMADAGLPVLQIMADAYGLTTIEIQGLMRKGLIPAHDAIEAITASLEGDFAGAAERQLATWAGIRNSMGDIKTMGLARIFVGIADAFKPFFSTFIEFMRVEGLDRLERFGEIFGAKFAKRVENLTEKFILFRNTIKRIQSAFKFGAWEQAFKILKVPQSVIDSANDLKESWQNIKDWWTENKEPLKAAIANLFNAIFKPEGGGDLAESIWNKAVSGFEALGDFFREDNGAIVKRINDLAEAIRNKLHPALREYGDWIATHSEELTAFGAALAIVFGTGVLAVKIEAIGAALGATGLAGALGVLAGTPFLVIVGGLVAILSVILILYNLILNWDELNQPFLFGEDWGFTLIEMYDNFIIFVEGVGESWDTFLEGLSTSWDDHKVYFEIAWGEHYTQLAGTWDQFKVGIEETWDALWETVTTIWEDFSAPYKLVWDALWIFLNASASGKWEILKIMMQVWLGGLLTDLASYMPDWVQAGIDYVQGLWDGMQEKWKEFKTWLEAKIAEAVALWNKLLRLGSPSKVMFEIGEWWMEGLMLGLKSMEDLPGLHVRKTVTSMIEPFETSPLEATRGLLPPPVSSVANNNQSQVQRVTKIEKLVFDFKNTTLTKRELERTLTQLGLLNATG